MEIALQSFFASVPFAVALWLLLLLGIAAAAVAVALPRRAPAAPPADPAEVRQAAGVALATDRAAEATDRAAEATDRAAEAAGHRRAAWLAAQEQVDEAWQAFDAADRAAREAAKAAAYPLLSRRRKPGDNVDRQRYLHHAAAAACRRRELSIAQLNDVFAHRGWNPRLHPVQQEGVLRAAIREHLRAGYQAAVEREQTAWQQAEEAAEALRALRLQTTAASWRAGAGQPAAGEPARTGQWVPAELPAAA